MIRIDFETRSEAKLKVTGAPRYAAHPTTSIHCMAYKIDDGPTRVWIPAEKCPFDPSGHLIEAHNSMFERCIWHHIMVKRFGWPAIEPEQWRCTASRVAAVTLPRRLEDVGQALHLAKQKDTEGHAIMMKLARPRKPSKRNPSIWHFSRPEIQKLREYCADDVETEYHLSKHPDVYELSAKELIIWQYDQKINLRGIPIDIPSIKSAIAVIGRWVETLTREINETTKGYVSTLGQTAKIREWCVTQGLDLPDLQKQTVTRALERSDLAQDVRKVLQARQSVGKSSTSKLKAMLAAVDDDGRVRDTLMYHGASPGRWTGRRIQPHNYPKPRGIDQERVIELVAAEDLQKLRQEFGDPMQAVSRSLRGFIKASPGKRFYGADYSKIEVCVLVWFANQTDVLQMLRAGEDVYVYQAMDIFDCTESQVDSERRDIGKRGVLGCGFQCGADTLREMVYKEADVWISKGLAKKVVDSYRATFDKVKSFWSKINNCVMQVIQTGESKELGHLRWGIKGNYLHCRLPSGRLLSYYKPEIRPIMKPWGEVQDSVTYMGVDERTHWRREDTFGGKLTENVVQATARDLLAESIPRAERAGYPIVFHVHDEAIAETDADFGSVKEFEEIMGELPDWAKGCPVKAEGWTGERYKK